MDEKGSDFQIAEKNNQGENLVEISNEQQRKSEQGQMIGLYYRSEEESNSVVRKQVYTNKINSSFTQGILASEQGRYQKYNQVCFSFR